MQFDLKSLDARGFLGTVDGWVTTISTAVEEDGGTFDPLDHKLVRRLLAGFLDAIADAEGKVAELAGQIEAAEAASEDEDDAKGTARIAVGKRIRGEFLLWAMRGEAVIRQIAAAQKGTTFQEITLGQLQQILLPAPTSASEQRSVVAHLAEVHSRICAATIEVTKLRTPKQGLMDDLLTGRVRVPADVA